MSDTGIGAAAELPRAQGAGSIDGDDGLVRRPHLVARLLAQGAAATIAPGGYGKSTLLAEAARRRGVPVVDVVVTSDTDTATLVWLMARSARRRGAAGLAGSLASAAAGEPVDVELVCSLVGTTAADTGLTVLVDEVGLLRDEGAVDLVARLARLARSDQTPADDAPLGAGSGLVLLVAGRELPGGLADELGEPLGRDSLALSEAEVRDLVEARGGNDDPSEIASRTRGWPAAVAVALTRAAEPADDADDADDAAIAVDVRGPSSRLHLRLPVDIAELVTLPLLSSGLAESLAGPGTWESLTGCGVPTRDRGDGWWVVPDPVRDAVVATGVRPSTELLRTAARAYADDGLVADAVALLLGVDDTVGVAALVAALDWTGLDGLSGGELRALERVLDDDAVRAHPRALLHIAWAAEHQAETTLVAGCLDRLEARAPDDDDRLRLLVLAERARSAVRTADLERATEAATSVRDATATVGSDRELATARGRATYAQAIALLYDVTPERLAQGDALLSESAALLRLAGVPRWESQAWLGLGFGVDLNAGRFGRSAERIHRGLALLPQQDAARARMLTFLVEVLSHLPRLDEAEAAGLDAAAIADRYSDHHLSAYAHWSLAWIATRRRDLARVRARLERVQLDLGDWYALPAGVLFHADAAEMLGDCGDPDGAAEHLRRGQDRADVAGRDDLLVLPSTLWEARYGDPRAAFDAIEAMSPRPRERWRYALVQAWCAHRLGDAPRARALAERAMIEAEVLGHPETVAVVEPELAAWAVTVLGAAGAIPEPEPTRLVLLGPVSATRGGVDVTPPPGHPTELLALLATRGATSADTIAATLWPEADQATARRRLRNLLHRVRTATGDVVVRDRDDRLALADDVSVDVVDLRRAVAQVNAAPAPERAGTARASLRLADGLDIASATGVVGGTALADARAEGVRHALTLLDEVIEASIDADDLEDAAALAARACTLAPDDEQRWRLLASVLRDAGRLPAARDALVRSLRCCAEVGAPPSLAHRSLARSLGVVVGD